MDLLEENNERDKELQQYTQVFEREREFRKWNTMYNKRFHQFYKNLCNDKIPEWVLQKIDELYKRGK